MIIINIIIIFFVLFFVLFFKCGDNIKDPKCRVFDDYTTVVVIARETTRTKIRCLVFIAYLVMPLNLHSPTSPFSVQAVTGEARGEVCTQGLFSVALPPVCPTLPGVSPQTKGN